MEYKAQDTGYFTEQYAGLDRSRGLRAFLLLLAMTLFALSITNLWAIYAPPKDLLGQLLHSAFSSVLTFGIVPFLFTYVQIPKGFRWSYLGLQPMRKLPRVLWIKLFIGTLFALVLIAGTSYASNYLIEHWSGVWGDYLRTLQERIEEATAFIKQPTTLGIAIVRIAVISLLTGVVEELYMRGVLQPLLIRTTKSVHIGILLTALIFSLLHLAPSYLLPIFIYGLLFGYWRHYTGSLYPSMLLHILNNLLTLLVS